LTAPLERRLGFGGSTAVNVLAMIGVGPFVTIPLLLNAMGGPQAMLGWFIGAVVALADGLVWAELGAAMPRSGGGYEYLLESYGARGIGRLLSFLFLWQTVAGMPFLLASGATGFAHYAAFFLPSMTAWQSKALAMAGCAIRLGAQAAVGFGFLLRAPVAFAAFEACFVLAGTVLPLALVHSWGRVFPRWAPLLGGRRVPRWLLLGPAFAIGGALTVYFSVSIVGFAVAMLTGSWDRHATPLPLAFFWVAMPAYLVWGLGLGAAAIAYYRVTRPICRVCGR
jgi:amino acid transporter